MNKTITFGIPCYNSSEYMDHCIESILEGSDYADDVQIVIVDDGSVKDDTAAKADAWQERYPNIIKALRLRSELDGIGGARRAHLLFPFGLAFLGAGNHGNR